VQPLPGRVPENLTDLSRTPKLVTNKILVPVADMGNLLGLLQAVLGALQIFFGLLAPGDVVGDPLYRDYLTLVVKHRSFRNFKAMDTTVLMVYLNLIGGLLHPLDTEVAMAHDLLVAWIIGQIFCVMDRELLNGIAEDTGN